MGFVKKKKDKEKNERIHWLESTEYIRYGGQKPEEKSFQALLSACVCVYVILPTWIS